MSVRFELTRGNPNRLAVYRLNHSANSSNTLFRLHEVGFEPTPHRD